LETILEYGRGIGVDFSLLLVSPFPDFDTFLSSISILPNQELYQLSLQPLIPLGAEEWYKEVLWGENFKSCRIDDFAKFCRLRVNIVRMIEEIGVPTPESVRGAISAAIADVLETE
jgi:hypothetical protein